ncbi:MAG: transglutaminase-like domain-containing protein [Patescibacteria group bacterium]
MKKIIFCLIFLLILFVTPPAFASSNFATDYNVIYTVGDDAKTHVVFDITLTNKTSQYYASSYNIQIGFENIDNLTANDPDGPITPTINENDDGRSIALTFNKKVVGIDNKLNFRLSFDTIDVAQKNGKIWQIDIPGLASQNDFNSFNVSVKVPSFLKNPVYIKPSIKGLETDNLVFSKDQLGKSGISIAYGKEQIYEFSLLYHLANRNLFPIKTEIAIPPTTNYQEIQILDITPKPIEVVADKDGNWLAQYVLSPSQKVNIKVIGKAKISLTPKEEVTSKDLLKVYLKEQPYWQTSNEDIKNLANTLKTPHAIYEYLVKNLKYDLTRVTDGKKRLGALDTLKNPSSAVCLEFTDLFIALARSLGVPAREVNGFAYTQNSKERPLSLVKDVLHAWPEYYDYTLKTWVMIDPTWGNTTGGVDYFQTLDFDHFAFVIKGIDSQYPVSAGGYKLPEDTTTKDVDVKFSSNFEEAGSMLSISDTFYKGYFSNLPIKGNIVIKNIGKRVANPQTAIITTKHLSPSYQKINLDKIPPFGSLTIPIAFNKTPILTNKTDVLTIHLDNQSISKNIKVYPLFLDLRIIGGILIVTISILLSIIIPRAWGISIFKPKQ